MEGQISDLDDTFNQAQLTQEENEGSKPEERENEDKEKQESEKAESSANEDRKLEQRKLIELEIQRLTDEMNSLSGLFASLKRKKLKNRISELNEQLREI